MKFFPLGILFGSLPWLVGCAGAAATEPRPRPALDRETPAHLETATFALG